MGLFQEARISDGKAAELLGLTRRGFVALLVCKGIPNFRLDPEEWEAEAARLHAGDTSGAWTTMPPVISNTGPLMTLADIGQLELLPHLFNSLLIPPAVRAEALNEPALTAVQTAITREWIVEQRPSDTSAFCLLSETFRNQESKMPEIQAFLRSNRPRD